MTTRHPRIQSVQRVVHTLVEEPGRWRSAPLWRRLTTASDQRRPRVLPWRRGCGRPGSGRCRLPLSDRDLAVQLDRLAAAWIALGVFHRGNASVVPAAPRTAQVGSMNAGDRDPSPQPSRRLTSRIPRSPPPRWALSRLVLRHASGMSSRPSVGHPRSATRLKLEAVHPSALGCRTSAILDVAHSSAGVMLWRLVAPHVRRA